MTSLWQKKLPQGKIEIWTEEPLFPFIKVKQVHGTTLLPLEKASGAYRSLEADGFSGKTNPQEPLCIVTADCLPVAIIGNKGIAFLHAGWRGLAAGILSQDNVKLLEPNYFFIGPHIHQCCYEIQPDFLKNFPEAQISRREDKLFFSLEDEAQRQISKFFPSAKIEVAQECTCCDRKFHSYRREGSGNRNYNIWIL